MVLPIFYIEDSFANYVVLEKENNIKEEYYKKPFIENALKKLDSTLEELKKNMENNHIGVSYMYPNETINPKHHVPNNQ